MTRLVPHPVLSLALLAMWLSLTRLSLGHALLGGTVALVAGWATSKLHPAGPRVRRWVKVPQLVGVVYWDILRSNLAVARIIVRGGHRSHGSSGFVDISLDLRDRTALAWLAVIVTATPGTAWIEHDGSRDMLLLHVLDLGDADEVRHLVKNRYEAMLLEIFE